MHKELRRLPSLDFLKGFEAAGRLLSFTRAAEELFVTQSALSRQIQALEAALGVALFVRRHRALSLTRAGQAYHREISSFLGALAAATETVRGSVRAPGLALSTTVSFASLWIIPRLSSFRARRPDVEVFISADDRLVDLTRGDVDVAIRYLPAESVPAGAVRLFGERMLPVASPVLMQRSDAPLTRPADLARHVLLHLDDPDGGMPWLDWRAWLAANGLPDLKPAGSLRFKLYDQVIQAAIGGQGVALGRVPLVSALLRAGTLVAPFSKRYESTRGYFAVVAPHAHTRADVAAFVDWLKAEALQEVRDSDTPPKAVRRAPRRKGR